MKLKQTGRRVICLLLAAVICTGGCGKQGTGKNENVTISIWHYYSGQQAQAFEEAVSEFNETAGQEKGITVKAESRGDVNEVAELVTAAAEKKEGSEEMPDIFTAYMDTAVPVYDMGVLVNLKDYLSEDELSDYVPGFLEYAGGEGTALPVMPVAKSTELFYLNKTDWEPFASESGCTLDDLTTWEGLADTAESYYEWSGGKSFFGRDAAANFMLVGSHQLGKDVFSIQDGKAVVTADDEVLKKVWDCYAQPYIKGYYSAYGKFRSDDMKTGDLISCVASTASVSYLPSEVTSEDGQTHEIECLALPLPNFENTQACAVQQGAGMSVTKSDETREKAAVEFLKWFTDAAQNVSYCLKTGYFPVKRNVDVNDGKEESSDSDVVSQNFTVGQETINNSEMYAAPVVENSRNLRYAIEDALSVNLESYREQYGTLSDDEKQAFLDNSFEEWSKALKDALK